MSAVRDLLTVGFGVVVDAFGQDFVPFVDGELLGFRDFPVEQQVVDILDRERPIIPILVKQACQNFDKGLKAEILVGSQIAINIPHKLAPYNKTIGEDNPVAETIPEEPVDLLIPTIVVYCMDYYYAGGVGQLGPHWVPQNLLLCLFQEGRRVAVQD